MDKVQHELKLIRRHMQHLEQHLDLLAQAIAVDAKPDVVVVVPDCDYDHEGPYGDPSESPLNYSGLIADK